MQVSDAPDQVCGAKFLDVEVSCVRQAPGPLGWATCVALRAGKSVREDTPPGLKTDDAHSCLMARCAYLYPYLVVSCSLTLRPSPLVGLLQAYACTSLSPAVCRAGVSTGCIVTVACTATSNLRTCCSLRPRRWIIEFCVRASVCMRVRRHVNIYMHVCKDVCTRFKSAQDHIACVCVCVLPQKKTFSSCCLFSRFTQCCVDLVIWKTTLSATQQQCK